MGFFDYFFSKKKSTEQPKIQFGRFSDAYKEESKYDAWDQALEAFENSAYLESYKSFFSYLSDESADNVFIEEHNDSIHFTFYQGSKKIEGIADNKVITAEAKIAKSEQLHIGFMRRLLEENYQMRYSRYALDRNNNITAVFTSHAVDGSPYKLYYGLKELATHADKKDDILINEFKELKAINNGHIREVDEIEKRLKFEYKNNEIDRALTLTEASTLNLSHYPGAESYIYLDLIYRLDYLLKPEGVTMEIIDEIHTLYFKAEDKKIGDKNRKIRRLLKEIQAIPYNDFCKEIYDVKSTFGITQPSGLSRIQEFIDSEIQNMDWYYHNDHIDYALSIPSYIVGYSLYSYSMPTPMRDLFGLFYHITQNDFFLNLGIQGMYNMNAKLNARAIKKEIRSILKVHASEYPEMTVDFTALHFDNYCLFSKSFLLMIQKINFQRRDFR